MNHLAIYNKKAYDGDYIDLMLRGIKTIDSKFTYRKTAPYGRLAPGDTIYLKESSGPVLGRIRVDSVVNHEFADSDEIIEYLAPYSTALGIRDEEHLLEVWKMHANKRYVCQWVMTSPETLTQPIKIQKHDMRIWVPDYPVPEELLYAFEHTRSAIR